MGYPQVIGNQDQHKNVFDLYWNTGRAILLNDCSPSYSSGYEYLFHFVPAASRVGASFMFAVSCSAQYQI
jgi:hypothetical protein